MYFRNRSFRWWHNRMMLVLAVSMVLTALLVKSGLVLTTYFPPGGIKGPVCFEAGGLFGSYGLFRHIECAHFFGSGLAAYLLSRGYFLFHPTMPVAGLIWLGLECLLAVPVAWVLGRTLRSPQND